MQKKKIKATEGIFKMFQEKKKNQLLKCWVKTKTILTRTHNFKQYFTSDFIDEFSN